MNKNVEIRKDKEQYFTNENETEHMIIETNKSREFLSPSKKFKLIIRYYKTKKDCWNYSRGTVYKVSDNTEICDIKRNYSSFNFSFVTKNDQEYLITGRSYMSQTIVNLDTGEEFEPEGDQYNGMAFCWSRVYLSPDGNTLLVDGCHWAGPYEYRFYDFTDPSKGWPELETEESFIISDKKGPSFNDDGTISCYKTSEVYLPLNKFEDDITEEELDEIPDGEFDDPENWESIDDICITLKRKEDKIVVVDRWISKLEQERVEKRRIAIEKYGTWRKKFKTSDPLYLEYQKLLEKYNFPADEYESQGITFKGWAPNFDKQEKRWCRRIVKDVKVQKQRLLLSPVEVKYTVDLNWAVETGPIKLTIFKDGKKDNEVFFEHSAEEMKKAFEFVAEIIGKSS